MLPDIWPTPKSFPSSSCTRPEADLRAKRGRWPLPAGFTSFSREAMRIEARASACDHLIEAQRALVDRLLRWHISSEFCRLHVATLDIAHGTLNSCGKLY